MVDKGIGWRLQDAPKHHTDLFGATFTFPIIGKPQSSHLVEFLSGGIDGDFSICCPRLSRHIGRLDILKANSKRGVQLWSGNKNKYGRTMASGKKNILLIDGLMR